MTGDYRTEFSFYSDKRTFMLKRRLGNDGLASLNFLWCWTAMNYPEGVLHNTTAEEIEAVSFWDGKPGDFVPTLLQLHWLDQLEDGTYALNKWTETNPWVATSAIREDEARFIGMAKNHPELYQALKAQGMTRISKEDYTQLIIEWRKTGQITSTTLFLRNASDALAPIPKPTPIPPHDSYKKESAAQETASAVILENCSKTSGNETVTATETTLTEQTVSKSDSIKADDLTNIDAVVALWNELLVPAGFPKAAMVTATRSKLFKGCIVRLSRAKTMSFWHELFRRVKASSFLCGRMRSGASWLTIDWVMSEKNFVNILEGKYDNDRKLTYSAPKDKPAVQEKSVQKQEEVKPEMPASQLELFQKIRDKEMAMATDYWNSLPITEDGVRDVNAIEELPEMTLEDYLRLKFPEADEEELRRDYISLHDSVDEIQNANQCRKAMEIDKACAYCNSPDNCALPSGERIGNMRPWVYLETNGKGKRFINVRYGGKLLCKHQCAKCPSVEPDTTDVEAPEAEETPNVKPETTSLETSKAEETSKTVIPPTVSVASLVKRDDTDEPKPEGHHWGPEYDAMPLYDKIQEQIRRGYEYAITHEILVK